MKVLFASVTWIDWVHAYLVYIWFGAFTRLFGVNVVLYVAFFQSLLCLTLVARFDDGFFKEKHYDLLEHPYAAIAESVIYAMLVFGEVALFMFLGASITGAIMTF